MIKVNIKHRLRKLSIGLVSVGTMFMATTVSGAEITSTSPTPTESREPQPTTPTGNTEQVENEETAVSSGTSGSADNGQEQVEEVASAVPVALTSATPAAPAVEEPKTIEVEKLQVEKEKSTLEVKDGEGSDKLIKHRDDKSREIFDVSRDVKVNNDDTLDVTLTVQPKQIDEGAEVMVLLDVSKKMTEDSFKTAKENIKKLVDTLTSKASDGKSPNARNAVRLITFYNKVSNPVEVTSETINTEIDKARVLAKEDRNWGVDLQGAIHRARQAFNSTGEKKSGKRQHIVLFSQGESTFSYDIKKDKEKLSKIQVDGPVTYSNPLLPWPFYFDTTTKTHNFVKDADKFTQFLDKVGISQFKNAVKGMASTGNSLFSLGNRWLGIKNPLDYITLVDLDTKELKESEFDYSNRLGEGYNFRSYYNRVTDTVGLKSTIESEVKKNLKKLEPKEASSWLSTLGLKTASDSVRDWFIGKALDHLFYRRQYQFYNHNLSAQAEAKIARDEGILFYSFDVTKPDTAKTYDKFDEYLKKMSEGSKFLEKKDLTTPDKFKDILKEVTITDTFGENVSVVNSSFGNKSHVKHTPAKSNSSSRSGGWWPFNIVSSFLGTNTKESLTWTINKDELAKAFEERKPVTFTYKLKVDKDKIKKEVTPQTIISNTTSYKINDKEVKDKKLEDVKVRYTKETIPVPKVEKENVGPQTPQEQPMQPLSPEVPAVPAPEVPKTETEPRNPQRPERPQEGIQPRRPEVPSDPRPEVPKTESESHNPQRPEMPQEDSQPRRSEVPVVPTPEAPKTESESRKPQLSETLQEGSQRSLHSEVPSVSSLETPKDGTIKQDASQLPISKAKEVRQLPQTGDKDRPDVTYTVAALTVLGAIGLLKKKRRDDQID
ncbi:serum opacification factor [Streptococcus ruminantium]|uniref:Serum opacification factor n=1 Tax=Streptococcus ruminantium TaxID=1917441 RepID=A0ABU1B4U2_9STRE|nr:serum opacification factor [Streptococcus ruminantium]MDQ8769542.1 serum opacification factor [Streptococcus ruminantium]MDQ8775420.1 serum opacification factor [Streptococcus ruminantium]MDQ8807752.1 serum opacification factor [Streptococcus ruminantium]MDQ8833139.1 serum opacification factor [Streptococcus ruminantium]MDQ8842653.1 serum opacification factor [Streptococcus ruminantium]